MEQKQMAGHLAALVTVLIWGTTYISTKVLLTEFQPLEILVFRFVMGFLALAVVYPKRLKTRSWREEILFVLAGLTGICLYYLLENIALTYTLASNVGVIASIAPVFTALLAFHFLRTEEKLHAGFFLGFVVALVGIALISLNGSQLQVNPFGDFLALLAAAVWGVYSILTRKIGGFGYPVIAVTRRMFFYGLLFMLPIFFLSGGRVDLALIAQPKMLGNLLFLGLGASALCFVTWNVAVRHLGAVKTSVYIYAIPVITVVTSMAILHERLTPMSALGTALTLVGLALSEYKPKGAARSVEDG